jgi:hypothetical protein
MTTTEFKWDFYTCLTPFERAGCRKHEAALNGIDRRIAQAELERAEAVRLERALSKRLMRLRARRGRIKEKHRAYIAKGALRAREKAKVAARMEGARV